MAKNKKVTLEETIKACGALFVGLVILKSLKDIDDGMNQMFDGYKLKKKRR